MTLDRSVMSSMVVKEADNFCVLANAKSGFLPTRIIEVCDEKIQIAAIKMLGLIMAQDEKYKKKFIKSKK